MTGYLMAIDQGTTSSRAIIFDHQGHPRWQAQQEFQQWFPQDGWVEHDAEDIWSSTLQVCRQVLNDSGLTTGDIAGIGITNQRETTLLWDRKTGEPLGRAIVWQDRRTADFCRSLATHADTFQQKTGLLLDPYFSGTKLRWLLDNVPNARTRAEKGELAFGTVDSFLLWRLTGGLHATDATNASRTLLYNIHQNRWDSELLDILDIPDTLLPEVRDCASDFGKTLPEWFGDSIAISAIAGDQQAALFGQACYQPGMSKSTYGTGCFMVLNTGTQPIESKNRLLTTIGYRLNGETHYALEGSIFMAGATIQWLRDGLKIISQSPESEQLARQADEQDQVYLVPAFTGLGAPYWDPHARGALLGMTRDTGIAEVARAGLESVCYQTRDLIEAMQRDSQQTLQRLRVDGGMVQNNWLMQRMADLLGVDVDRSRIPETTALGAAYLAGLQTGVFDSLEQLSQLWSAQQSFQPAMPNDVREKKYRGWLTAVKRIRSEN